MIPLQDALGLDSDARMNTPSRSDDNWTWRYEPGALTRELAQKLAMLAEVSDRDQHLRSASFAAQQRDGEAREDFAA